MANGNKKRRNGILGLLLSLCLLLFSCGGNERTAAHYAEEILQKNDILPYGVWYREDKEPWEEGHFDESLRKAIFGEREIALEEVRLFLSTQETEPFELAFVTCYTYKDADSVGALLSARLRLLQKSAKESGGASLDGGFVMLRGRTVLYVAAASADKIRSALGI